MKAFFLIIWLLWIPSILADSDIKQYPELLRPEHVRDVHAARSDAHSRDVNATRSNVKVTKYPELLQEVKATKYNVNGIDVYLINTHTGNAVALTVNVQAGSWHDEPTKLAGRAHLWEHVIHGGSKKYPGQKTFWGLTSRMGAEYNAYTSYNRIFYHYYLHPEALSEAISVLGAMISNPEWDETTFEKEKASVKNEAFEYQQRDERALESSIFINLLPKGHPLAMYNVGTQTQLTEMPQAALQELYYSNYVQGSLQIVVAGNLDSLEPSVILGDLTRNFNPPQKKQYGVTAQLKTKVFPSVISEDPSQSRVIEIGSQSDKRLLELKFEADNAFTLENPSVVEVLLDLIRLKNVGSFQDFLIQRGWITGLVAAVETVNNLSLVTVQFQLTQEGSEHRSELPATLFAYLSKIRKEGILPQVLEYLKLRNILSYTEIVQEADHAAELFAKTLDFPVDPTQAFDFKKIYGGMTALQVVQAIERIFNPQKMLMGYLGPDVKSENKTPVFDRPMILLQSPTQIETKTIFPEIKLVDLKLPFSETPLQISTPRDAKVMKPSLGRVRAVLKESHASTQGAVHVQLELSPSSLKSYASLLVFRESFKEHFKAELEYMESLGIKVSFSFSGTALELHAAGNAKASAFALTWLVEQLKTFSPVTQEIEKAKENLKNAYLSGQEDFTALIAVRALKVQLNKYAYWPAAVYEAVQKLTLDKVIKSARLKLSSADVVAAFEGDFDDTLAQAVLKGIRQQVPKPLTRHQRLRNKKASLAIAHRDQRWLALEGNKTETTYGIARAYEGPSRLSREYVAFLILGKALNSAVFQLNRIEKDLGYVHSASVVTTKKGLKILFYGQTEGHEKFPQIELGWKEILDKVFNGDFSQDGFQAQRTGFLREQTLISRNASERALEFFQGFYFHNDPAANEKIADIARTLTGEEIVAVARKYLDTDKTLTLVTSKTQPSQCENLLTL